eukprot:5463097-Amphidinium_carterae.1
MSSHELYLQRLARFPADEAETLEQAPQALWLLHPCRIGLTLISEHCNGIIAVRPTHRATKMGCWALQGCTCKQNFEMSACCMSM